MEGVVELNFCLCFPQNLYHEYATEFTIPLLDQYNGMPGTILRKATLAEGVLDQAGKLIPMRGFGQIFPCHVLQPGQ